MLDKYESKEEFIEDLKNRKYDSWRVPDEWETDKELALLVAKYRGYRDACRFLAYELQDDKEFKLELYKASGNYIHGVEGVLKYGYTSDIESCDYLICPHCGYANELDCEDDYYFLGGDYEENCNGCGRRFAVCTRFLYTTSTEVY